MHHRAEIQKLTKSQRDQEDAQMAAALAAYESRMATDMERMVREYTEGEKAAGSRQGGTDASSRRLDRLEVSHCPRCGGRLYSEPGTLQDGTREMVCFNCGGRSYR